MNNLKIYGHYGSHNHGNEAIVRGVSVIFDHQNIVMYSFNPDTDMRFKLNAICEIHPFFREYERYSAYHIFVAICTHVRIIKNKFPFKAYKLRPFFKDIKGVYMLEAGDQYCEGQDIRDLYAYINMRINKMGGKTVMLPCTIRQEDFINNKLIEDLKQYSLIFARESLTYNALVKSGFTRTARFAPDPAFVMKPKECELPNLFSTSSIVGLTIGILAQGKESYTQKVIENSKELIRYIISNTDFSIALIPHVNVGNNLTDVVPIQDLYNEFKYTGRITKISEKRADELKYVISKCRFMVTLRTHASIAAYSTGVPTLVIGYSQKSVGIAKDLFGTSDNYVINIDSLNTKNELSKSFKWLVDNEKQIQQKLREILPSYLEKSKVIYNEIAKVIGE